MAANRTNRIYRIWHNFFDIGARDTILLSTPMFSGSRKPLMPPNHQYFSPQYDIASMTRYYIAFCIHCMYSIMVMVRLYTFFFASYRYITSCTIMDDKCFFECRNDYSRLINCGSVRIKTVRNCSVRRGEGLANKLVPRVETIRCHKSCVSTYTSEYHIQRYLFRQQATSIEEVPLKKFR